MTICSPGVRLGAIVGGLTLSVSLVGVSPATAAPSSPLKTMFSFASKGGDWIGAGQSAKFTPAAHLHRLEGPVTGK